MPENLLFNIETAIVAFVLLLILVLFAIVAIIIFISARDARKFRPAIRTVDDIKSLTEYITYVKDNIHLYKKNVSYLMESQKQSADLISKNNIGLIVLKNTGNSSAIDVTIRKFGGYVISDGPETKPFSLSENQHKIVLFYLPNDMLNELTIQPISVKYKSLLKLKFRDKFYVSLTPSLRVKVDESTKIHTFMQV